MGACTPPFEEVWQLTNFRVLGVVNNPAEVDPGSTDSLALVTADTKSRNVDAVWFGCSTPISPTTLVMSGAGTVGGCPTANILFAQGTRASFAIPAGGGTRDGSGSGRSTISLIGFACAGGRFDLPAWISMLMSPGGTSAISSSGSLPQPPCNATDAASPTVVWQFSRSIFVRDPIVSLNPANQNPMISEVQFGAENSMTTLAAGTPATIPHCDDSVMNAHCPKYTLRVLFADGAREAYKSLDPMTRQPVDNTERFTVGYVVSAGKLEGGYRTDSPVMPMNTMDDAYTAPATAQTVNVYITVSDGRGGFGFAQRQITVE